MTKELFKDIIKYLFEILKNSEFENHIYAVGGSVRDYIMGNEIKDIDLVLDIPDGGIKLAKYLSMCNLLCYAPVLYPTYGTCQFRLSKFPEHELEAVHTRGEQYHDKSSRKPVTHFSTILDDSMRRDLTINALYYDVFTGEILDPTKHGLVDIKNHVIRTTNENPDIVFNDDPLRILRVIRFASRYDWEIEEKTYESLKSFVDRLNIISNERINAEIVSMIGGPHPENAFEYLCDSHIFEKVVGNINADVKQNIFNAFKKCTADVSVYLRLAVLYASFADVEDRMHDLKFSNNDISRVSKIISHRHDFDHDVSDKTIRRIQYAFGNRELFFEYLKTLDILGCFGFYSLVEKLTNDGICNMFEYKLPVTGDDVMREYNIEPGPKVKKYLDRMLDYAFECPDANYDELIKICR